MAARCLCSTPGSRSGATRSPRPDPVAASIRCVNLPAVPRTRIRTRKSAIAEYWLGTEEGRTRLPGNSALVDFGEPGCFACGWMATDPDEPPDIWRVWDRASLERCHLVPAALGGPDAPDSLVLLCARCHVEAPDVGDPEYMLSWISAHDSWGSLFIRELQAAMERHEVQEREIEAFNQLGVTALLNMRGLMRTWAIPVAGKFSYATLAACSIETVRRALAGDFETLREQQ
jgi:hypothetical protein